MKNKNHWWLGESQQEIKEEMTAKDTLKLRFILRIACIVSVISLIISICSIQCNRKTVSNDNNSNITMMLEGTKNNSNDIKLLDNKIKLLDEYSKSMDTELSTINGLQSHSEYDIQNLDNRISNLEKLQVKQILSSVNKPHIKKKCLNITGKKWCPPVKIVPLKAS